MSKQRKRVLVLCLTYGEPHSNAFRPQFLYSLYILRRLTLRVAPIPRFVLPLLAARRGRIRRQMFEEKGYHSPLDAISESQAAKIKAALERHRPDIDFDVRVVMEFKWPFLPDQLREWEQNPPDDFILLPLYMAESDFTTGISRTDLAEYHRGLQGRTNPFPPPAYVAGFGFDERLGKYCADFIVRHLEKNGWTPEKCANAALVLGAHGTLVYPPEGINGGARETLYLYGLIRKHLVGRFKTVRVAWLNHALGGKWTQPAADETAAYVWEKGIRDVVYFPFGFMADNNESQNEGKDALEEFEWNGLLYLPCPNDDEEFCELLAEMTIERLDDPMREDWDAIERGGRRDLVQRPRPAVAAPPGFLKATSPVLATIGILFWFTGAIILLLRGSIVLGRIEDAVTLGMVLFASVLIGWFKGTRIIGKVALKNLRRLRTVPQPSPLWKFLSVPSYIVIAFFMGLGISLRFAGIPTPVYATILVGVGLSLLIGGIIAAMNYRLAIPLFVLRMDSRREDLRKALELGMEPQVPLAKIAREQR